MNTDESIVGPEIAIVKDAKVPKPAKLIAKEKAAETAALPGGRPAGWWNLTDLSGSLEGVTRAVQEAADVPANWKAAIVAELALRCGTEFNFVWLDAHFFVQGGKGVLHCDIEAEKVRL